MANPIPACSGIFSMAFPPLAFWANSAQCHCKSCRGRFARAFRGLAIDREPEQRGHIDDERDLPIAEDCRAGDAGDALEEPAQRLDDGLALAEERIDDEARAPGGGLHDAEAPARPARAVG